MDPKYPIQQIQILTIVDKQVRRSCCLVKSILSIVNQSVQIAHTHSGRPVRIWDILFSFDMCQSFTDNVSELVMIHIIPLSSEGWGIKYATISNETCFSYQYNNACRSRVHWYPRAMALARLHPAQCPNRPRNISGRSRNEAGSVFLPPRRSLIGIF